MNITPDSTVFFQFDWFKFNATILFTLIVMLLLTLFSSLITRRLSDSMEKIPKFQHALEVIVDYIHSQIREITGEDPKLILPFIGTLFLFISVSNFLSIVPYFAPPTSSFSTTAALAVCVFASVPFFGIKRLGAKTYFQQYLKPTPFLLPFKIIGEVTRTFALAMRLFGNIMSGTLIVLVLVSVAPLFLPIIINTLGLLIGQIQAYIFAVLATIYIGSALRIQDETKKPGENPHG